MKGRPSFKVTGSETTFNYVKQFYPEDMNMKEFMFAIYLNAANKIIGHHKVGEGGVCGVYADTKLIMSGALNCLATAVILVNNHPSGNMKPSEQDNKLTKRVKEACNLFEISLLDHLIVGHNDQNEMIYYSFADEGTL